MLFATDCHAIITLNNGESTEGLLYSFESDFPPGCTSLAVVKEVGSEPGTSNYTVIANNSTKSITRNSTPSKIEEDPLTAVAPNKWAAYLREQKAVEKFANEKSMIGENVTSTAQEMFNMLYKQLPKNTRWYNLGESQDLVVLGVRVAFPYTGDCCTILEADGQKSLQRISKLVASFVSQSDVKKGYGQ